MKRYRLVAMLLLLLASWSASAAEIVPLLSQSVLATASVRLNLRQTLAALVTEKLPEYSRPQLAAIQYRYEQQLQEKARLGRIDTDQVLVRRVRRIARQLARQAGIFRAGAEHWAWEVHVINDPMPGAFSKPGGKIDITTGMINGRNLTDDEIAAVLAHEMGHVLTNRPLSHVPASNVTRRLKRMLPAWNSWRWQASIRRQQLMR